MFLVDIDECEIGNHTCLGNSTCVNAAGSFRCFCNKGFAGDGSKACYGMYCKFMLWRCNMNFELYTLNVRSRGKQLVLFSRGSCCFPRRSRGKHQTRGKAKLTSFPRDHTLSVLLYIQTFIQQKQTNKDGDWATTAQLYPSRDTFEFDQRHMMKNQPITVLILLSESLAI